MSASLGSILRIVVVGAGMSGLAAVLALARNGFTQIHVYETASNLGFVGAGIQMASNLSRQLQRLGVWEYMAEDAVEMEEASVRERYGYPHRVAHRAALANALYEGSVVGTNFAQHRIQIRRRDEEGEGHWIDADVILGADGVKSIVRKSEDTGQSAYRIMLRRDQLAHDPELLAMLDSNSSFRWIGAKRHIIAYPISAHTIFNISTAQPDTNFAAEPTASWTTRAEKDAMLRLYSDFCPSVRRMLGLVTESELCEWKLRVHRPLRTWVEGNVALLGDACHPTLPHLGQGASQAIEDGAVLAFVLASLRVYERLRKSRTKFLVTQAAASGLALHLSDPAALAERDEAFRQVRFIHNTHTYTSRLSLPFLLP
ncbi:hypothetical protein K438DRAFT_1903660 [Mycena galopus ATCC 62051]|nr:hypothetical protein K438DRAFT_1903660 [Mycena galopus ATCC 62051]